MDDSVTFLQTNNTANTDAIASASIDRIILMFFFIVILIFWFILYFKSAVLDKITQYTVNAHVHTERLDSYSFTLFQP